MGCFCMSDDLKIIKKKYGEKMMHFIRENFSTLLDTPGLVSSVMLDTFYPTHSLYYDLVSDSERNKFIEFIYSTLNKEEKPLVDTGKSPKELMNERGYILKECTSELKIQMYKKYYQKGEELCTFYGGRLNKARVFFAVKKNVNEIIRENFKNPEREDEYGTSVISIQFSKNGSNTLSIKNRYNHTVANPDATFSNDLDNIIPGLTKSFEDFYGIKQIYSQNNFHLDGYVRANDGKFYKYKTEINNVYFCADNIIIDNFEPIFYDKSRYLVLDYFIIDFKKKAIFSSFVKREELPSKLGKIDYLERNKNTVLMSSNNKSVEFTFNENKEITRVKCENLDNLSSNFLCEIYNLDYLELKGTTKIKDYFLHLVHIKSLNMPDLVYASDMCLTSTSAAHINMPKLKYAKDNFLEKIRAKKISFPSLVKVKNNFLFNSLSLEEIYLPKLKIAGENLLVNTGLTKVKLPELVITKEKLLYHNNFLKRVYLPKLVKTESEFLTESLALEILIAPNLREIVGKFRPCSENIKEVYIPNLRSSYYEFNMSVNEETKVNLESLILAREVKNTYIRDYVSNNIKLELISRGYSRKLKR